MDATAWLQREVAIAVEVGDPARHPELVGAAEALAACGAVRRDVADAARRRLEAAFALEPLEPPRRDPAAEQRLEAVLTPLLPVAVVDERTVVVVAVELWSRAVVVRFAGEGADDPRGHAPPFPLHLLHLPLRLEDDRGTTYAQMGGQVAREPPWRVEWRFVPAVPAAATELWLSLHTPGTRPPARVRLDLPQER